MKSATVSGPCVRMRRASISSSGVRASLSCRRRAAREQQQPETGQDERQREELSHGQAEGEESEESIGLAEQLGDAARHGIADEKDAAQRPGPRADGGEALEAVDDEKQDDAFEGGLVELAGMARLRTAIREDHGPRHVADAAPQLRVDEVGQAAEEQADRHGADDD